MIILFSLIAIQIIAYLIQTIKIVNKATENKEDALKGVSFYAFSLGIIFLVPGIFYEFIYKDSKLYGWFYLLCYILGFICSYFIIYSNKLQTNSNKWKVQSFISAIFFITGLGITFGTFTVEKIIYYVSVLASIGFGLTVLPLTITIFKKGDNGISVLFLTLTLISNIILAKITMKKDLLIFLIMSISAILKFMCIIRIYLNTLKKQGDSKLKTKKNMEIIIGSCIGIPIGYFAIEYLCNYLTNS